MREKREREGEREKHLVCLTKSLEISITISLSFSLSPAPFVSLSLSLSLLLGHEVAVGVVGLVTAVLLLLRVCDFVRRIWDNASFGSDTNITRGKRRFAKLFLC